MVLKSSLSLLSSDFAGSIAERISRKLRNRSAELLGDADSFVAPAAIVAGEASPKSAPEAAAAFSRTLHAAVELVVVAFGRTSGRISPASR